MSDSKVYMFPEQNSGNSNLMSILGPMLSQRGIDPGILALMKNNSSFGGEGGWFMWVIFLFFLMGWGGNGFGFNRNNQGNTDYLSNQINNDSGRELLMQAINGNGSAINQLASTLNCDSANIQQAINGVMSQVQNVGNQVGMSSQQVINSIQAGDNQIASQLSQCCCNVRQVITEQGYQNQLANERQTYQISNNINSLNNSIQQGFCNTNFNTQQQTCSLQNTIKDTSNQNTVAIMAKLDQMQTQSLYDKIDALRETKSTLQNQLSQQAQTATFGQMISQAITPINTSLCDLSSRLASIECNQPLVAKVPYTPAMGGFIPVNYGLNVTSGISTLSGSC